MTHGISRTQRLALSLLLGGLLGLVALSGVARASGQQPIEESGTETDCPVFSSSDPNCTLPAPPGGVGIPCLDPALPRNHGDGGGAPTGNGGTTTTQVRRCGGVITSHFNGNPPVIGEFSNTHCPRSGSETRADFRRPTRRCPPRPDA